MKKYSKIALKSKIGKQLKQVAIKAAKREARRRGLPIY